MSTSNSSMKRRLPLFSLGQIVATPGALRMLQQAGVNPMDLLAHHAIGDWGNLCEEDNRHASSAFRIDSGCAGRRFG